MACQTSAHTPKPPTARPIPTIAPANSPSELLTAIMRTSIRFIRRLVCTMAEALIMKVSSITRVSGMSRRSPWNISAMSGAQKKRMAYTSAAMPRLNHSTVL